MIAVAGVLVPLGRLLGSDPHIPIWINFESLEIHPRSARTYILNSLAFALAIQAHERSNRPMHY